MQAQLKPAIHVWVGAFLLSICSSNIWAATSTNTVTQANQVRGLNEAEQAARQGQYAEASSRYEALAALAGNAERDHFTLLAARQAQLAGQAPRAQGLLNLVGKNLNANDNALRAVVAAMLALNAAQPPQAIALLDQIPLPYPEVLAPDIFAARMESLFAAGRTVLAVNTAVERERTLKTQAELTQNRQMLWNHLKQVAGSGRDLTPPPGATRLTAGWLELAALFNSTQREPFAFTRGLAEWRDRYPDHPGSNMLINSAPGTVKNSGQERIALLLPLSGKQQAAGIAVRDGFLSALLQLTPESRPSVDILDTNEEGATEAYQRAVQLGADMIVGPLLKEDVEAVASQVGIMTLSLNTLSNAAPPALLFQFALDPEEEARQVAQRAHAEGHSRAIMLTPNNEWGQRVQRAFTTELQALGGTLVAQRSYDAAARDYVALSKALFEWRQPPENKALNAALGTKPPVAEVRSDFDYIFLAAQAIKAKQVRPALRFVLPDTSIPIYATSDSYETDTNNDDLDGLRFTDMPWVINPGSLSKLHDDMARLWSNGLRYRSRLYAFGIDAFTLIGWLKVPQPQLAAPLQGATGQLVLDQFGRIRRQAAWAQIVNGRTQLLPELSVP